MENHASTKAMTRDEFFAAAAIASPESPEVWITRAASIILSISSAGRGSVFDEDTMMYVIQRLALMMPAEYLVAGTIAMLSAADEIENQGGA